MVELRDAASIKQPRWSSSCEHGWRATRFPPTSRSSTRSPEHPPARPTSVRSGSSSAIPSNMPSESLTVAEVLRRQARDRGRAPAAGVRRRTPQLRGGRPPVGTTGPRSDRSRRGKGHPRRPALPERCGVDCRDVGRGAHRRCRHTVFDLRHCPGARGTTGRQRHRNPAGRCVLPISRLPDSASPTSRTLPRCCAMS